MLKRKTIADINQTDLSERSGVSRPTIGRTFDPEDDYWPRRSILNALAMGLGVSRTELEEFLADLGKRSE